MADIHKYLQQRRAKYDADWKAYHERNRQRRQKIKQFLKLVLHWMKHPEQHVTPWDRLLMKRWGWTQEELLARNRTYYDTAGRKEILGSLGARYCLAWAVPPNTHYALGPQNDAASRSYRRRNVGNQSQIL